VNREKSYMQMHRELGVNRTVEITENRGDYRIIVLKPEGNNVKVVLFDGKANTLESAIELAWLACVVKKQNRSS